MKSLNKKHKVSSASSVDLKEAADLFLRLCIGLTMALAHGMNKLPPPETFIHSVKELGFPAPALFAWSAGISECVGGILLAAGLFTRPAAFFMAFTMAVAAFGRHGSDPFVKKELALLYLAVAVYFALKGAGRYSLDALIKSRR